MSVKKYFPTILALLFLLGADVLAQTSVNMVSGTTRIDLRAYPSGTIYDNGGPSGAYSNNFDGMVVLYNSCGTINLTGTYTTESNYDRLYVYDGDGRVGTTLVNGVSGSGSVNASSTTGFMTIYFHSDGSISQSGFALSYSLSNGTSCADTITNLSVSAITQTSATVNWQGLDSGASYWVSVNGASPSLTTPPLTLSSLTMGSHYQVVLSHVLDSFSPCCTKKIDFFTTCSTIQESDLPLVYGFEDATGTGTNAQIRSCWLRPVSGSPYPQTTGRTGSYSLYFSTSHPNSYLVFPQYVDDLSRTELDIWLRGASNNPVRAQVGVLSDPGDIGSFELVGQLTQSSSSYSKHTLRFNNITANNGYIAIFIPAGSSDFYIDDINLHLLPQCPNITRLQVNEASGTGLVVEWDCSPSIANNVTFQITATPSDGGSPITQLAYSSPAMISGLTPTTGYYIMVTPLCDSAASGSAMSVAAATGCLVPLPSSVSGSSNTTSNGTPVYPNAGNSISQSIYTPATLRSMGVEPGPITAISYNWYSSPTYNKEFAIYIGTSSRSNYSSSSYPITTGQTLVYSGPHTIGTTGERQYHFSAPFVWDGVSNVVVTTMMNQPWGESQTSTGCNATSTSVGTTQSIYYYQNTPFTSIYYSSWYTSYRLPNVKFTNCDTVTDCVAPLIMVDSVTTSSMRISWSADMGATSWTVMYKMVSESGWHTAISACPRNYYVLQGLQAGTHYEIRVGANCTSGSTAYSTTEAQTPCKDIRFEYDNLYSPNVVCRTGSTTNPNSSIGVVDNGSASASSQHTIHTDPLETDPRTGNQLYTVPTGYCSSVRLGNWNTNYGQESITYNYRVDTNEFDLLLLKYAAVMQDPNHSSVEQPKFIFTITDAQGNTINPCYNATFISNPDLGWNRYSSLWWKDWTTVGVDLSAYQGMNIQINLATYDCTQGGHYGYAYFAIDLANKNVRSNSCQTEENTFYAPDGFSYRWYPTGQPDSILSTSDSLHVEIEGYYTCELGFVGAPDDEDHRNCSFSISAFAGIRYPYARYTYSQLDSGSCSHANVRFFNQSIITRDIEHTDSIGSSCESYLWQFDDGTTTDDINPRHAFSPGLHTVTLFAMLADGACVDTSMQTIMVVSPCMAYDTLVSQICLGDTLAIYDTILTQEGVHLLDSIGSNDTIHILTVFLTTIDRGIDTQLVHACDSFYWSDIHTGFTQSGIYSYTIPLDNLCDSLVLLDLTISPSYTVAQADTICLGDTLDWGIRQLVSPGIYTDSLVTSNPAHCDSLVTMTLTVHNTSQTDTLATACDAFSWNGHTYTFVPSIPPTKTDLNVLGCDSVTTLRLTLLRSTYADTFAVACDSFAWYGTTYSYTPFVLPTHNLTNSVGCDSTVRLTLTLNRSTVGDTLATACDSFHWQGLNFVASDAVTLSGRYTNAVGCDSTVTLHLTVHYTTDSSIVAEACDTFYWFGTPVVDPSQLPGPYIIPNTMGCDSIISLASLVIHPSSLATLHDTICENLLLTGYPWLDTVFQSGTHSGAYDLMRHDRFGCDSVTRLQLEVNLNTSHTIYDTIVENQKQTWSYHGVTLGPTFDTQFVVTLANQWGCDSLVHYHMFVWPNVSVHADTAICDNQIASFLWHGLGFADTLSVTIPSCHGADSTVWLAVAVHSTYDIHQFDTICSNQQYRFQGTSYDQPGSHPHLLTTQHGCDSLMTLHLHVHPAYLVEHYDTIYYGDTLVFQDSSYSAPGSFPHQYATIQGCDSVHMLHLYARVLLHMDLHDSICQGDTLQFHRLTLSDPGVYYDTVFSHVAQIPDTLVQLTLDVLPYPTIDIDSSWVCGDDPHYTFRPITDGTHLHWDSRPYDALLGMHEFDTVGVAHPSVPTTYTLTADYRRTPLCPTTVSFTVEPLDEVKAHIETAPRYLTVEERELTLYNRSSGHYLSHNWYVWYNDDEAWTSNDNQMHLVVPNFVDSLKVGLEVTSKHCSDTAILPIPIKRSSLFFPNVFTPSMNTNNLFKAVGMGVIGYELWVYDRRGDLMFHTTDINEGWDGTNNGKLCPQASYVYRCRYAEETTPNGWQSTSGTVTLLR